MITTRTDRIALPAAFKRPAPRASLIVRMSLAYRDYRAFQRMTPDQRADAGITDHEARTLRYADFLRRR